MEYKIVRSKRRTLCLQVIDSKIIVRSPYLLPQRYIDRFIEEKHDWIKDTLSKIESKKVQLKTNEIFFLGKKRLLNFSDQELIEEEKLQISTRGESRLEKKLALEKFLKDNTVKYVTTYLAKYKQFSFQTIKYSVYKSKWGSCSANDELTFNTKLSMCPVEVIEYIVVHELCHTIEKNHSLNFWNEVKKILPDYKLRRKWLRENRWCL